MCELNCCTRSLNLICNSEEEFLKRDSDSLSSLVSSKCTITIGAGGGL